MSNSWNKPTTKGKIIWGKLSSTVLICQVTGNTKYTEVFLLIKTQKGNYEPIFITDKPVPILSISNDNLCCYLYTQSMTFTGGITTGEIVMKLAQTISTHIKGTLLSEKRP